MKRWTSQTGKEKEKEKSMWNINSMFQSKSTFNPRLTASLEEVSSVKKVSSSVRSSILDALQIKVEFV